VLYDDIKGDAELWRAIAILLLAEAAWTPRLSAGRLAGGLVLSRKAAAALGADVGSMVTFRHPQAASGGLRTADTQVRVAGIDASPMRGYAYLDAATAAPLFGLPGMANLLTVLPSAGHSAADVQRALLDVPHVAAAQCVQAAIDGLRASLDQFTGILNVAAGVALLLVLLIAYGTAATGTDERSREHATMMAFGLPARTVLGMTATESVLVGVLGTVTGVAAGYGLLAWLTATTIASVMPEIGVTAALSAGTIAAAVVLGTAAVAAAPCSRCESCGGPTFPPPSASWGEHPREPAVSHEAVRLRDGDVELARIRDRQLDRVMGTPILRGGNRPDSRGGELECLR
jgi:putative ABC transport system permease protein